MNTTKSFLKAVEKFLNLSVINRIVGLLSRSAHLEAAAEAAMKQAESATNAARTLMETDSGDGKGVDKMIEDKTKDLKKELESVKKDRDAIKRQALGLQEEYDRVCERLNKHEKGASGDKKKD